MNLADIARHYVVLGLRAGRLQSGLVDSYTGPEGPRRQVAGEPRPEPAGLAEQAARLRAELAACGAPDGPGTRRDFLDRQLVAVACAMHRLAGRPTSFGAELRAYFDTEVAPGEQDDYRAAHAELAELLPGGGPLAARLAACRRREELPPGRLAPSVQALSVELRALTCEFVELPAGETVYYEVVTDRPWSGFNHHLGGHRSRVTVNADATNRCSQLADLVAHEAYPGHHTERCRTALGPLERTLSLVNTPQSVLSEGLADCALGTALGGPAWGCWAQAVLAEVGVRMDGELAERVGRALDRLRPVRQDAALLLHDRGADPDEVLAFLRRWLLVGEPRARQVLRFLAHPLWRTYTTSYVAGHQLVRAWLDARPAGEPAWVRHLRLLDEPWSPSALRRDLDSRQIRESDVNAG